jgi:hypothetical protein
VVELVRTGRIPEELSRENTSLSTVEVSTKPGQVQVQFDREGLTLKRQLRRRARPSHGVERII